MLLYMYNIHIYVHIYLYETVTTLRLVSISITSYRFFVWWEFLRSTVLFWLRLVACRILVPLLRIKPVSPALETWSLNHWTAWEVPNIYCLNNFQVYIVALLIIITWGILDPWFVPFDPFTRFSSCCRNQYSRKQAPHWESWRTQVYYAGGPRGVHTPSSEPQIKGLQRFLYTDRHD